MNKRRVTYTVGQGFDKNGRVLTDILETRKRVYRDAACIFGGFTARMVEGGWINGVKDLVMKPSLEIVVVTAEDNATLEMFAVALKSVYNQESVLMAVEALQLVEFI